MATKRKADELTEINAAVLKYLQQNNLGETAKAFAKEAKLKGVSTEKAADIRTLYNNYIQSQESSQPVKRAKTEQPVAASKAEPMEEDDSSSSESESDSDSDSDSNFQSFPVQSKTVPTKAVPVKPVATKTAPQATKKDSSSSEESSSNSDDSSSEEEKPVQVKAAPISAQKKVPQAVVPAKKAASSSSSSSSSEDSSDDDSEKKPVVKATPVAKTAVTAKKQAVEESSSDSSEDDSEEEKKEKAKVAPVKVAPQTKKVSSSSSSGSSSESEESDGESSEDEKPAAPTKKAAPTPVVAIKKQESSSESSSGSEESSSEEEEKLEIKNKNKAPTSAVKTESKPKSAAPVTTPKSANANGSTYKIYVKGLPWQSTEEEVREFFQDCGTIVSCELPLDESGRSSGTAYVKFAERSELDAALALDGQTWKDTQRWLKIVESSDKQDRKSFGGPVGERPEGCDTVFVGNLPWDVDEDGMRALFSEAGEISNVRFATAEDGSFRGFGHVQFYNGEDTVKAIALAGRQLNGRAVRVDYAPPRNRESFGGGQKSPGGGRGGRGGGRGGFEGGRGGRGGFDGGRGGRGGSGTTPNKKNAGVAISGSGKKTTFDD